MIKNTINNMFKFSCIREGLAETCKHFVVDLCAVGTFQEVLIHLYTWYIIYI